MRRGRSGRLAGEIGWVPQNFGPAPSWSYRDRLAGPHRVRASIGACDRIQLSNGNCATDRPGSVDVARQLSR